MLHILSIAQTYALPFIVVISIVVFVHEFGHYWIARRCGVKVESFSIGFGKALFSWTDKHGTRWQVAWLPLGGYVKMFGDADAASTPDNAAVKSMTEAEKKVSLYHQSVEKRAAIVAAGPVTNYLFAIVVLAVLFVFQGQPYSPATVGSLVDGAAAAQAGLQAGDKIVSIDGASVERFEDIKRIIGLNEGTSVVIAFDRNGVMQTATLTPEVAVQKDRFGGEHKMGRIGIVSNALDYKKWPPVKAVKQAVLETYTLTADTLRAMGQMVVGTRGSDEIGGPLRIAEMSGHVAQDGVWALLWFMAVISVNLGLINLFPVPLLDGGHLMFFAYEKLFGKPMHEKAQDIGLRIGLTLVISLMVFATWNDLVHLNVVSKIRALFS